jgi:peptide/nickel transport system substrate-binding protein
MRTRSRALALTALGAVAAMVVSACGGGEGGGAAGPVVGAEQLQQGQNEINALPRDQVREGGDLRWPLDAMPDNFNRLHVDGTLAENSDVMSALLPSAFEAQADRAHLAGPPDRHLHDQPRGHLGRRDADHLA